MIPSDAENESPSGEPNATTFSPLRGIFFASRKNGKERFGRAVCSTARSFSGSTYLKPSIFSVLLSLNVAVIVFTCSAT